MVQDRAADDQVEACIRKVEFLGIHPDEAGLVEESGIGDPAPGLFDRLVRNVDRGDGPSPLAELDCIGAVAAAELEHLGAGRPRLDLGLEVTVGDSRQFVDRFRTAMLVSLPELAVVELAFGLEPASEIGVLGGVEAVHKPRGLAGPS